MASNMVKRVAFAAVAIPAVGAVAWLGGWPLVALLAAAGGLGAREVFGFARAQGLRPLAGAGIAGAALAPLAMAMPVLLPGPLGNMVREGYVLALGVLIVALTALRRHGPSDRPLASVAVTVFGALYAGWLLSFALVLRHPIPPTFGNDVRIGLPLLFYPLVLTWAGDSAAMFGGKAIGGRKLAPVLSPNKTWAGGLSAFFVSVALSVIYAAVVFPRAGLAMSVTEALIIGAAVSVTGQAGDVAESLFKREAGLKDSSTLIPGHGGVLDRLDSLYFALPVTAFLFRAFGII